MSYCLKIFLLKFCVSSFYGPRRIIFLFLLATTFTLFFLYQNEWFPYHLDDSPAQEFNLTYWNPAALLLINNSSSLQTLFPFINNNDHPFVNLSSTTAEQDEEKYSRKIIQNLSTQFQNEFTTIQTPTSCSPIQKAIVCTISNTYCGFGCLLHYQIGCLMLAYSLKLPLIYKDQSKMILGESLDNYLEPIVKVNCSSDLSMRHVIRADWRPSGFSLTQKSPKRVFSILAKGLPVPKKFAELVTRHQKNSYLWFVSQFMKMVFKIRPLTAQKIEKFKEQLGISQNNRIIRSNESLLIGMHVRRTDKFKETRANLSTQNFMKAAQNHVNHIKFNATKPVVIFVASEDCTVISEFEARYAGPDWTFVGDRCRETLDSPEKRRGHVFEIIRDISVLVDTDHVICTYSSNVCRAVLEIRNFAQGHLDPEMGVTSLDGVYNFMVYNYGRKFTDGLFLV